MLNKEYEKLGKKLYESSKSKDKNEYKDITLLLKEIEEIEKEINKLNNVKVCSKCGSKENKLSNYCSKCGSKL